MKKSIFGLVALATAVGFASCSSDEPLSNGTDNNLEKNSYINVQINTVGSGMGTRADDNLSKPGYDFAYGTDDENAINSLILCFYDEDGKFLELANVTNQGNSNTSGNNIAVTVPVSVPVLDATAHQGTDVKGATQIVAYINIPASEVNNKPLSDIQAGTLSSYNPYNGFAMTNSGYYGGEDGAYIITTPIKAENFYKVGETSTTAPVQIYVERVAAKIQLAELAEDVVKDVTVYAYDPTKPYNQGDAVTLTFVPGKWGIQAQAKKSYILKQNLDAALTWDNGASNFRSFWAKSVGYDVASPTFLPAGVPESDSEDNLLAYSTFGDFNDNGVTIGESDYTHENTFGTTRLTGATTYNPWSAVTSVVLTGTYEISSKNYESDLEKGGFYLRPLTIVNTEGKLQVVQQILTEAQMKAVLLGEAAYVTKDAEGKQPLTAADVEYVYVEGENGNNPANARYLQVTTEDNLYVNGVSTTATEVNNSLAKTVAPARLYAENKAFFYIPLKHYASPESTSQYLPLDNTLIEGNYGIVRNNWYVLTINTITNLGTGVGGDTDIPVPDPEVDAYAIDATINVLQWHMRNQSVDL